LLLRRQMRGAPRPSARPAFLRLPPLDSWRAATGISPILEPRDRQFPIPRLRETRSLIPRKTTNRRTVTNRRGKSMKKLLLIGLAVSGLALVPWQRADAQVIWGVRGVGISFGFPRGYYATRTRYNLSPYSIIAL